MRNSGAHISQYSLLLRRTICSGLLGSPSEPYGPSRIWGRVSRIVYFCSAYEDSIIWRIRELNPSLHLERVMSYSDRRMRRNLVVPERIALSRLSAHGPKPCVSAVPPRDQIGAGSGPAHPHILVGSQAHYSCAIPAKWWTPGESNSLLPVAGRPCSH